MVFESIKARGSSPLFEYNCILIYHLSRYVILTSNLLFFGRARDFTFSYAWFSTSFRQGIRQAKKRKENAILGGQEILLFSCA